MKEIKTDSLEISEAEFEKKREEFIKVILITLAEDNPGIKEDQLLEKARKEYETFIKWLGIYLKIMQTNLEDL